MSGGRRGGRSGETKGAGNFGPPRGKPGKTSRPSASASKPSTSKPSGGRGFGKGFERSVEKSAAKKAFGPSAGAAGAKKAAAKPGPRGRVDERGNEIVDSRALKAGAARFGPRQERGAPPRGDARKAAPRGPKRGEDFGRKKPGSNSEFSPRREGGFDEFASGKFEPRGGGRGDKARGGDKGEDRASAPPRGPARSSFEARPQRSDAPQRGPRNAPPLDSPRVKTGSSRGTAFTNATKAEAMAKGAPRAPRHGTPGARPGKQSAADKEANGPQHTSPRVAIRQGTPLPGTWIWTSREDTTSDLIDELTERLGERGRIRLIEAGLVESRGAPTFEDTSIDVTFARQGFLLAEALSAQNATEENVLSHAARLLATSEKLCIQVWAPDTESGNRRMPEGAALTTRLEGKLVERMPEAAGKLAAQVSQADGAVLHVVMLGDGGWLIGESKFANAISPFVAGRARMRIEKDKPSRAARKVEEALHWMGIAPGSGEVCVDLGAAPGGWSWVLLEKRARVIAIDPAELRDDVAKHRGLKHVKASAFQYEPDEQVDWLFCDMAWRPLEAAQLLAKWGRRKWARVLVANLKLPMKQKHKMVEELRAIVNGGGWKRVRTRQLYHDRDEITLIALS